MPFNIYDFASVSSDMWGGNKKVKVHHNRDKGYYIVDHVEQRKDIRYSKSQIKFIQSRLWVSNK